MRDISLLISISNSPLNISRVKNSARRYDMQTLEEITRSHSTGILCNDHTDLLAREARKMQRAASASRKSKETANVKMRTTGLSEKIKLEKESHWVSIQRQKDLECERRATQSSKGPRGGVPPCMRN